MDVAPSAARCQGLDGRRVRDYISRPVLGGPAGRRPRSGEGNRRVSVSAPQHDNEAGEGTRRVMMRYAGMGFELAAAIIGLTLLGLWFDYHFKTAPAGVLVGAGIGIVGGLFNFIKAALRLSASEAAARQREKERGLRTERDQEGERDEPG